MTGVALSPPLAEMPSIQEELDSFQAQLKGVTVAELAEASSKPKQSEEFDTEVGPPTRKELDNIKNALMALSIPEYLECRNGWLFTIIAPLKQRFSYSEEGVALGLDLADEFSSGCLAGVECPSRYHGIEDVRSHWDSLNDDYPGPRRTMGSLYRAASELGWKRAKRQEFTPLEENAGAPPDEAHESGEEEGVAPRFYLATYDNPVNPSLFLEYLAKKILVKHKNGNFYQRNQVTKTICIEGTDAKLTYRVEELQLTDRRKARDNIGTGQLYELWETGAGDKDEDKMVGRGPINLVDYLIDYTVSSGQKLAVVDSIEFDPSLPPGLTGNIYNEFHGWTVEPKQCDTRIYWDFVRDYICINEEGFPNQPDFDMFKAFFAQRFQTPAVKPLIFLSFFSPGQGSGRGTVLTPILTLMADYVADANWDDILGDKNGIIKNKLIISVIDKPAPPPNMVETLKSFVTELFFRLREMQVSTKSVPVVHHSFCKFSPAPVDRSCKEFLRGSVVSTLSGENTWRCV